jgi:hypothetical protein
MAARTFTTAGVNNLWSNAANWDGGVSIPVDLDSFTIPAGQTCIFDVDQSLWAGMAASTIAATGTLIVGAGNYVLKINADLTLNGTLQVGTSRAVPFANTFKVDFSAASNSIVAATTGRAYIYCTQPTNPWTTLSAQELVNQTVLSIDPAIDLTTDAWAIGNTIRITDVANTEDSETVQIANIAAGLLTITGGGGAGGGLAAQKESGAYITLITRNVRFVNSTDYIFKTLTNSDLDLETEDMLSCDDNTLVSSTFTSQVYTGNANSYTECAFFGSASLYSEVASTFDTCIFANAYSLSSCTANTLVDSVFFGTSIFYSCRSGVAVRCVFYGTNSLYLSNNHELLECTLHSTTGLNGAYSCNLYTCVLDGTTGINIGYNCKLYNCDVSGLTSEFTGYNGDYALQHFYTESTEHDQTTNALKTWTNGGIVTSQTASPPTGYTIYYDHEVESSTKPCFRQYQATVLPGTAIEVSAVIRNTDGIDVSATTPIDLRPRLEIIDVFADPLVDSTQTALDSDPIADADGSDTSWQAVDVIWANTGDSPRQVYVRIICYSHDEGGSGAGVHTIDEAWSVANYQDQIQSIYDKLPTNYIMGSSDVDNHDTDIDSILEDTGTTLDGIVDTILVDTNEIQGKLPDNYIMGSSDTEDHDDEIDAIVANLGQVHTIEDESPGGTAGATKTSGIAEGC